ncbi:MAG: hypothetical protein Q9187_001907 [Circinaria calcarea]
MLLETGCPNKDLSPTAMYLAKPHVQLAKMVNLIDLDIDEQSQTEAIKFSISAKSGNQKNGVVRKQSVNLIDFEEDRQAENAEKLQVSVSTTSKVNTAVRTSLVNPENSHWSRLMEGRMFTFYVGPNESVFHLHEGVFATKSRLLKSMTLDKRCRSCIYLRTTSAEAFTDITYWLYHDRVPKSSSKWKGSPASILPYLYLLLLAESLEFSTLQESLIHVIRRIVRMERPLVTPDFLIKVIEDVYRYSRNGSLPRQFFTRLVAYSIENLGHQKQSYLPCVDIIGFSEDLYSLLEIDMEGSGKKRTKKSKKIPDPCAGGGWKIVKNKVQGANMETVISSGLATFV